MPYIAHCILSTQSPDIATERLLHHHTNHAFLATDIKYTPSSKIVDCRCNSQCLAVPIPDFHMLGARTGQLCGCRDIQNNKQQGLPQALLMCRQYLNMCCCCTTTHGAQRACHVLVASMAGSSRPQSELSKVTMACAPKTFSTQQAHPTKSPSTSGSAARNPARPHTTRNSDLLVCLDTASATDPTKNFSILVLLLLAAMISAASVSSAT